MQACLTLYRWQKLITFGSSWISLKRIFFTFHLANNFVKIQLFFFFNFVTIRNRKLQYKTKSNEYYITIFFTDKISSDSNICSLWLFQSRFYWCPIRISRTFGTREAWRSCHCCVEVTPWRRGHLSYYSLSGW